MSFTAEQIIEALSPHMTDERRQRIQDIVAQRTYSVIPVLEDLYDRGNVSAVMRSAEAFGLQEMHLIEPGENFKESARVTQGADKWLDLKKWKTTKECVASLKGRGYKVCVTSLEDAKPIEEIDFTKPTALVFGNERDGASQKMLELSDERMIIPMQGFTQSFNISVAAAISFYHVYWSRIKQGTHGDLSDEQKQQLMADFYQKSVGKSEEILDRLLNR